MQSTDRIFTIGLDLGQTRNHTALVVMERVYHTATPAEFIASGSRGYQGEYKYTLVRAERLSLGTPYPRVVDWVIGIAKQYGSELDTIVIDATGVGSAIVDALRKAHLEGRLIGVVITGNQAAPPGRGASTTPAGYKTVARSQLLTGLQYAVQAARFAVDLPKCKEWEALRRELSLLRLEASTKGKNNQDDLAFALSLTLWWLFR